MACGEISVTIEESNNSDKNKWLEDELGRSGLKDMRLRKRFKNLLEQLWDGLGQTIPFACQDWANTKAAYRFLSNSRVKEDQILAGHFQSTKDRVHAKPEDKILILQDTTEFSYHRDDQEAIGSTCHPTTLVKWRQRIGEKGLEKLLSQTIDTAKRMALLPEKLYSATIIFAG